MSWRSRRVLSCRPKCPNSRVPRKQKVPKIYTLLVVKSANLLPALITITFFGEISPPANNISRKNLNPWVNSVVTWRQHNIFRRRGVDATSNTQDTQLPLYAAPLQVRQRGLNHLGRGILGDGVDAWLHFVAAVFKALWHRHIAGTRLRQLDHEGIFARAGRTDGT